MEWMIGNYHFSKTKTRAGVNLLLFVSVWYSKIKNCLNLYILGNFINISFSTAKRYMLKTKKNRDIIIIRKV